MYDQAERLRNRLKGQDKQAKTIAIVSGKGGVGKSNTALNFSIELQNRGKKVLLFDLDVGMGNIDILLGNESKHSIVNLFNEFLPIHDIIELGPKGLSYIAGGSSLNELIQLDEDKLNYFYEQYDRLVNDYDYILFDLGAGASISSMSFVLSSDECVVITTPEPTSITDAYSMIKHIILKRKDMPISVIMNRCNSRKEGVRTLEKFNQVVSHFLHSNIIKMGMLPNDQIVSTAVIRQTPYILLNKNAPVSKALNEIVTNFLQQTNELNELQRVSFVQKLKHFLSKE
ncbi:MinD/ParA family protein [Pseudogracilibacillus auburnensis]|uniref:Flagellar biosynthesis protein FlhG n=1 Tax=Pseudogracilibacillus auburnensis TaxID=1494959 RepID=A0A2V3W4J0_9BACI|nr:MinD/ParA family protein [Pseudogracilibacillus auburnensis]MBO1003788.1 MinD/ParA family protein [Pseudogracilibacillus auburnensis]PXW88626.1 flagellar biosynthesis protein FlhG [Pseudogracilibacillus auburnensis]